MSAAWLSVFRAGEGNAIRDEIRTRLGALTGPYVVWIDQYFRAEQLEYLSNVPQGVAVRIIASESHQRDATGRVLALGDAARAYETAWRRRFDVSPPHTT